MPYTVWKRGNKWAIVDKNTGKQAGKSTTKKKAKQSANIRNRAHGGKRTGA